MNYVLRRRAIVETGAGWADLTLERFCSFYEHRTRPELDWADRRDTCTWSATSGSWATLLPRLGRFVCSFMSRMSPKR
jgi:hypothetical protein